jgi:hypothetical protein
MLTAQGRNGWAQIEHSEGGRAQFVPNTTTNPNQSEPTAANVSVAAKGNPLVTGPPDTSSKLVLRQTLLGRSTSRLRETGHGGGLVPVSVSVAFVRLRSPTLRSDPVMPADREHARTTGKPGCGRQPNAPLLALLVNSGLRRGEALALHWSDIDLDAKLLGVRGTLARVDAELVVTETKTAKSRRVVPLSPTAENVLHDVRTRQKVERRWLARCSSRPVRLHNRTGEPCDPRNALRALKAAATRAKLFRRLGCIRCGTPLPRSCCRPACRSRWSLRSSVTRASRSLETSMATSRLTCLVTH